MPRCHNLSTTPHPRSSSSAYTRRAVRCTAVVLLWASAAMPVASFAQEQAPHSTSMIARLFPIPAVRGTLTFPTTAAAAAQLNGQPVQTAPQWLVYDAHNKPVKPEKLQGQTYSIKYVMDPDKKLLHTVWLQAPVPAPAPAPAASAAASVSR